MRNLTRVFLECARIRNMEENRREFLKAFIPLVLGLILGAIAMYWFIHHRN